MTLLNQLFKCDICGNVAQIVHTGAGSLVCCGEEMEEVKEQIAQQGNPHFAIVEKNEQEISIKFNHEMIMEHHIEFVEVVSNDEKYLKRKYFKSTEPAEMKFKCDCKEGFKVRVYCNIHGLITTKGF